MTDHADDRSNDDPPQDGEDHARSDPSAGTDERKDAHDRKEGDAEAEHQEGGGDDEDEDDDKPSLLQRPWFRILAIVIVIALVIGGIAYWIHYRNYGKFQQSTNNAYLEADDVSISPKVSGYVIRVLVGENQFVRAGQPLVQIDARQSLADVAQAQAQVAASYANARSAEAQIGQQRAQIAQAAAELAAAQDKLAHDQLEVDRYAPLAGSGASPRERLAQLVSQRNQSADTVRSRRATVVAQQRRIGQLRASVDQALSQAEAAKAQVRSLAVDLGSTMLRAPIDGIVGNKNVRVGRYVQAGTELMAVVPLGALYLKANFKETQLTLMRPGQPATIHVDALPGANIPGVVESIAPATGARFSLLPPENATGNFTKIVQRVPVRIRVQAGPEARRVLVSGLSAEVSVDTRAMQGYSQRVEREAEEQTKVIEHRDKAIEQQVEAQR
ncbi:HlyD family secretion protein [uncultured Sphingomonas sp.]|uniref:HlyD family secretion protein n=1 Tax=uncultured Sphingomonas sp. TaxID=158754 RepID=UPI0025D1AB3E|nr:HlyD family secretion protein [uncultured Sphingomonas sp.]